MSVVLNGLREVPSTLLRHFVELRVDSGERALDEFLAQIVAGDLLFLQVALVHSLRFRHLTTLPGDFRVAILEASVQWLVHV